MLQFQAGEYCICIWDGEKTELGKSLESLGRYTKDEQAAREAGQTLYEIADTVTACLNLVRALGYTAEEFQKQLDMADESNTRK